jgi:5-formyltetrahydrofolate cyclo-ligase
MPSLPMATRADLRKQLRRQRAELQARQRAHASRAATRHLTRATIFLRARHIAVYHAADHELDPAPLVAAARRLGKQCYLPVLHPFLHGKLVFVPWDERTRLRPNRFGILEPAGRRPRRPARQLDLVVVPLVGFAADGTRLGMGGGYYDRSFAFRRICKAWPKPRLLGFAYACQQLEQLTANPWDIRLDAVVTEQELLRIA